MSILLPDYPLVNQMTTWTDDGQPSENAPLDCAYGDLAMFFIWAFGERHSPDYYHDLIAGQGRVGVAWSRQIAAYLRARGVDVGEAYGLSPLGAYDVVGQALAQGYPTIVLSREALGNHYTTAIGLDDARGVVRANPNGGVRETLAPWDWRYRFAGDLLTLRHHAYAPRLPAPPPPPVRYTLYRFTRAQHLRTKPNAASSWGPLMLPRWECIALGPVVGDWVRCSDLTGHKLGWVELPNVRAEGTIDHLPPGITPHS